MGRLSKIESVVNDSISAHGHTKMVMRGLPYFSDPLLRGDIRFAKRSGNNISFLNPDNQYKFNQDIPTKSLTIPLKYENSWVSPNSILSFGPDKEYAKVEDVSSDNKTLILKNELTLSFTVEDSVVLYASPLKSIISALPGSNLIEIKSHWFLANGDFFCYLQSENLLESLDEIKIERVEYLGLNSDPYFSKSYRLHLTSPITAEIKTNQTVYFRALPAYQSQLIRIPNVISSSDPMGPFLLDYLSGRLVEGKNFEETFSIKSISNYGAYVHGSSSEFETVDKNYSIIDRPWSNAYVMFWDLISGSVSYSPSRIIMKIKPLDLIFKFLNTGLVSYSYSGVSGRVTYSSFVDLGSVSVGDVFLDTARNKFSITEVGIGSSNPYLKIAYYGTATIPNESDVSDSSPVVSEGGSVYADNKTFFRKFCIASECIPPLPAGRSYKSSLRATTDASVRVIFHPNAPQEFNLTGGANTPVVFDTGSAPVTSIEINMTSLSDITELFMTDWTPLDAPVDRIQYSFVSSAVGISNYQASGIIIKPLFHGIEYLKANYDNGASYDSGKIYF